MTSLMLFFSLSSVFVQPISAFANETTNKTEVITNSEVTESTEETAISTEASTKESSTVTEETSASEVSENTNVAKQVEVGESQNANDSPSVTEAINPLVEAEDAVTPTVDGSDVDTDTVDNVYVGANGALIVNGEPTYYADGTTPAEYDKLLQQGTAIQLRSGSGAQITYLGPITYSYWTVGQFLVNGKIAFCIEHTKGTPATDTPNTGVNPYDNTTIRSILYYGWGGDANVFASNDGARGIVITSLALSNAYTGGDKATADEAYQVLMNKVNTAPITNKKITLNGLHNSLVSLTTKISGSKQVSSQASFDGKGTTDYISFNVPAGMTYVCENTGATATNANVKVYSGQKFHFEASLDADISLSSGNLNSSVKEFQSLIVKPLDSSLQTLGTGQVYSDPSNVVSFSVKFSPQVATAKIVKKDDSGNPLAGVTFEITNTANGDKVTKTTDANGVINHELTPDTAVSIKEVKTLDGYLLDENPQTWTAVAGETHEFDFVNPKQTIGTTATDAEDGDKTLVPEKKVTIVDAVDYKNLYTDGREYTVKGTLMVQETGKALLINGKEVTAEKTFVPTTANGKVNIEFTINASALAGKKVVAFEDLYQDGIHVAVHNDINDVPQTVEFTNPSITTTATNSADGSKLFDQEESVELTDTVAYKNLEVGDKYRLTGTVMDKTTGKALVVDDKEVKETKEFTTTKSEGTVNVDFSFSGKGIKGDLVVYETLERYNATDKTWYVDVTHANINDEGQTVHFTAPTIHTIATNKEDGSQTFEPLEKVTLVDNVKYTDLIEGKVYKVTGTLMDKETGKALLVDGKEVHASRYFIAGQGAVKDSTVKDIEGVPTKTVSGSVDVTFTFSGVNLAGKTIVAFENLYRKNTKLGTHADINDEGQTVEFTKPKIHTTAMNAYDATKFADALDTIKIKDNVYYEDLVDGKAYSVTGKLMNKETGEPFLVNGKEVTKTVQFIAHDKEGVVTTATTEEVAGTKDKRVAGVVPVYFEFSGLELQGSTVVAFETLSREGTEIAVHSDINDEGQTVEVPKEKLQTTATNAEDGSKDLDALKSVTLNDNVKFTDLIAGKEYTVNGVIMDKSTGNPLVIDGKEVQSSVTFIAENGEVKALESGTTLVDPDEAKTGKEVTNDSEVNTDVTLVSGNVNVSFTFDASSLAGKTLVVFEDLKRGNITLAVHHDLNDEGQTVEIHKPKLETTATANGKKEVEVAKSVTITDKVAYTDLIIGKEYTIKGVLMDKTTNKALIVNGKEVIAEKTFTAQETNGFINIDFTFDASNLSNGQEVVVFESLYREGQEIAIHNDINDKDQTITFTIKPNLPQTSDSKANLLFVVLGLVMVGLAYAWFILNKKRN